MLRSVPRSSRLLLALLLASCSTFATEPATPLSVTLVRSSALQQPPSFAVAGGAGTIDATWDTYGGACDVAEAVAERSGDVVTIHLVRSGEAAQVCIMIAVAYRYVAHVSGLAPGQYQVRVVSELGQPSSEIGTGAVTVTGS